MKTIKILVIVATVAIYAWLFISFIDVNLHNGINSTGSVADWNAWKLLVDIMKSCV